jgi:hypothetical protein
MLYLFTQIKLFKCVISKINVSNSKLKIKLSNLLKFIPLSLSSIVLST